MAFDNANFGSGQPMTLKVYLGCSNPDTVSYIRRVISMFPEGSVDIIGDAPDIKDLLRILEHERPDVLLLHSNVIGGVDRKTVEMINRATRGLTSIVGMMPQAERTTEARLNNAGIDRVIIDVSDARTISDNIHRAHNEGVMKRLGVQQQETVQKVIIQDSSKALISGGIIAVHSPKGGAGKTFTASHLAYGLAEGGYRTILVDFNLNGAMADIYFRSYLKNDPTHYQINKSLASFLLMKNGWDPINRQINREELRDSITPLTTHLDLLIGMTRKSALLAAGPDIAKGGWAPEILGHLANMYQYVVVDIGAETHIKAHSASLNRASLIIEVTAENSEAELRWHAENVKDSLIRSHVNPANVKKGLVITRWTTDTPKESEIRAIFRESDWDPDFVRNIASDDPRVSKAKKMGIPVLADREPSIVKSDIEKMVNAIREVYGSTGSKKKGIMGGLFGGKR